MDSFTVILLALTAVGVLYSYVARKFTTNKLILYLPSYIGIILILFIFTLYNPNASGFDDLVKITLSMLILPIILGNTISGLILNRKSNK